MSGVNPNKQKIIMTIANNIILIIMLDILINVGIVDTGNFILVTK